jgi:hypothetical protein
VVASTASVFNGRALLRIGQLSFGSGCRVAGWMAGMLFSVVGAWLLLPSRNVRGLTLFESRVNSCTLSPSGISVSLFDGDAGPMASEWYSVTERAPWSPFRHQIFYAYATPVIERVRCRPGDTLDLVGLTSTRSLSLGQMATSLRENPLLFVRDSAVHVPPLRGGGGMGWWNWWGSGLLAIGCVGLALTSISRFWRAMTRSLGSYVDRQVDALGGAEIDE